METMNNSEVYYYGDAFAASMGVFMLVFMVLTVGGNVVVIVTILGERSMRTCRTYQFYMSLALADLLVGLFGMPFSMVTVICGTWIFGEEFCKVNGFMMGVSMHSSVHTLTAMGIHEYICLTRPSDHHQILTTTRVRALQLYGWIWAVLYNGVSYTGIILLIYKPGSSQCGPSIPMNTLQILHSAMNTVLNLVLPGIIMFYCYYNVYTEAKGHYRRLSDGGTITRRIVVLKQRRMSLTLVTVLLCFSLCWTPYLIYSNVMVFINDKESVPPILNPIAYWFGYMNSACNPIIYALRNPNFREGYKQVLLKRCHSRWDVTPRNSFASILNLRKQSTEDNNRNSPRVNEEVPGRTQFEVRDN